MLQFFRKFQRVFFFIVTIIIAISFTFFGTMNRAPRTNEVKRTPVAIALDNSQIYLDEIREIKHFLNSGYQNPIFISLVLESGLGHLIAQNYFDQIQNDLAQRLERAKNISTYEHFAYPEFSAKNVWKLFHPELLEHLDALLSEKEPSLQTFDLLASLYLDQTKFSPELLKRILIQNLRQLPHAEDPKLIYQDLHLFGFTTTSSWFGESFLDLVSQTILNISRKAEKEGYQTTDDQLRQDFLQTFQSKEAENSLRYSEASVIRAWKPIYIFKTYTEDLQNSILHDKQMFENLSLFDKQKAKIISYSLPKHLECKSFRDLLKLQIYLGATTMSDKPLDFSADYLPIKNISENFPELVEKTFHLKIKKINTKELSLKIPLKKMWQWQSEEENWKLLCNQFGFLDRSLKKQERFSSLQQLSSRKREPIDQFSRENILSQSLTDLNSELSAREAIEKKIVLRKKQQVEDFSHDDLKVLQGVQDFEKLYQFLDSLTLNQEGIYVENETDYFSFVVMSKTDEALVLFEKANVALEELLKKKYDELKEKQPFFFRDETGQFKSIDQTAYQISRLAFTKLWEKYTQSKASNVLEFLNDFKQERLAQARSDLIKNSNQSYWIASHPGTLEDQWKLVQEEKFIEKEDRTDLSKQVFSTENFWSSIEKDSSCFFHIIERTNELDEKKVQGYKDEMSRQFAYLAFTKILDEIKEKKAAVLLESHQP